MDCFCLFSISYGTQAGGTNCKYIAAPWHFAEYMHSHAARSSRISSLRISFCFYFVCCSLVYCLRRHRARQDSCRALYSIGCLLFTAVDWTLIPAYLLCHSMTGLEEPTCVRCRSAWLTRTPTCSRRRMTFSRIFSRRFSLTHGLLFFCYFSTRHAVWHRARVIMCRALIPIGRPCFSQA